MDWLVADIANGRAIKPKKAKPEPKPETTPRPFAVARGDRNWTVKSRIRTFKNLGRTDDEVFGMLVADIRQCFEDGEQLLADKRYVRKLRAAIRKIPTLGVEVSLRNLTHHRRIHRSTTHLSALRECFLSCPQDITPADARTFFSVRTRADHERMRRELHRHGYVYVGARGSHAGIWSRRPAAHNFNPASNTSSLSRERVPSLCMDSFKDAARRAMPHHRKVCMNTQATLAQEVAGASFIHRRYGDGKEEAAGAAENGGVAERRRKETILFEDS